MLMIIVGAMTQCVLVTVTETIKTRFSANSTPHSHQNFAHHEAYTKRSND